MSDGVEADEADEADATRGPGQGLRRQGKGTEKRGKRKERGGRRAEGQNRIPVYVNKLLIENRHEKRKS